MHTTDCLKEAAAAAKMPESMLAKALCHYATERVFSPDETDTDLWGELLVEHAEAARELQTTPAASEDAAPAPLNAPANYSDPGPAPTEPSDSANNPLTEWWTRGKALLTRSSLQP